MNNKINITGIDLFCGAGGLTRGLLDAGIKIVAGFDIDASYKKTYEFNNKPAKFVCSDVRVLTGAQLETDVGLNESDYFLLAACAPCQPFSQHNRGHRYDRRKSLLLEVSRLIMEMKKKPDFILIENVPYLKDIDDGRILREFNKNLNLLGYAIASSVIDAKDYGIPQRRKRFILIGVHNSIIKNPLEMPPITHGLVKDLKPYKTVRDAIGKFPPIRAGKSHPLIPNHATYNLTPINKERLSYIPRGKGGNRLWWPKKLQLDCHKRHDGHSDVYGRMGWDAPSPTLTCRCTSISNGRFGHPSQLRAISAREAATLQTFPEKYEFFGTLKNISFQIGNAVPPLLAKVFGEYLMSISKN